VYVVNAAVLVRSVTAWQLRSRKKWNEGIQKQDRKERREEKKRISRGHIRPSGHRLVSSAYAIKTMDESSQVPNNNNKSL
jgi:hypothetical protein